MITPTHPILPISCKTNSFIFNVSKIVNFVISNNIDIYNISIYYYFALKDVVKEVLNESPLALEFVEDNLKKDL